MATKRITIPVNTDIDVIREQLQRDTGIRMTYAQVFNWLVHFYMRHKTKTEWRAQ
jgi:hypothetical protein